MKLISTVLLAASLSFGAKCPTPRLTNYSKQKYVRHDMKVAYRATQRCAELYEKDVCLIEFRKTGYQSYKVICGEER